MSDQFMEVYLDLLPNQPKNDQSRDNLGEMLRNRFEQRLPDAVERVWELPPIILRGASEEYVGLLKEARDLFVAGYFYSCVAMCGIVGERLVKDLLRSSVLINKDGNPARPSGAAFDQFERADLGGIIRFLKEAELMGADTYKATENLVQLRNKYAHARGREPGTDAIAAIKMLHTLVEGTVSVFKDFEIKEGKFVPKTAVPTGSNEPSN